MSTSSDLSGVCVCVCVRVHACVCAHVCACMCCIKELLYSECVGGVSSWPCIAMFTSCELIGQSSWRVVTVWWHVVTVVTVWW